MKYDAFTDLIAQERVDTDTADNNQSRYAADFKVNAAGELVNALYNVILTSLLDTGIAIFLIIIVMIRNIYDR